MSFFNVNVIANIKKHIRFLNSLININKAFYISIIIKKSNNFEIEFDKSYIQINQGFDINVIFNKLIRFLNLKLYSFSKIEFKNLFMRIANH